MASTLVLDGSSLTMEDARRVLRGEVASIRLDRSAVRAMRASRELVEECVAGDEPHYGINTGFGKLAQVGIPREALADLQRNLILSHAAGVGPPLDPDVARLALVLRANALARGFSGIRVEVVRRLLDLFEAGVAPVIPCQGSVGASGDLAPLSHIALLLIGRGEAFFRGRRRKGASVLRALSMEPLELEAKEGLALINGTQVSTAIGVAAWLRARALATVADLSCAMTVEAVRGSVRPFDARVHRLRGHPGQIRAAENVRRLLRGSRIVPSHRHCGRVQDPYALRCAPQVHGAARDALEHAGGVLAREMNAVTDNPLLFASDGTVVSQGNFHGEPVAMAADIAAIAVAELASISERRIECLMNPDLAGSGLPPFLVREPGLHSGHMISQVTAAALVSENKTLCHPASVDSIPTSAGKEDHVSMATWAARKFLRVVENAENVQAIELLCAAQGLDLHDPRLPAGRGVEAAHRIIRSRVPTLLGDREPAPDIERVRALLFDDSLVRAVRKAAGALK